LPAGTRDDQEPPDHTAERELAEETGHRAANLRLLVSAPLTPGYSTEVMHFYLATGLTDGPTDRDVDERMDVAHLSRADVAKLIHAGDVDVKTIAGLALAGWSADLDG
jgi:ADP-ribose pyrophosphatase